MTSIFSESLRILFELLLVLLIVVPTDVAIVNSGNDHGPLLPWNARDDKMTFDGFATVSSAVDESTGVARTMQNTQDVAVLQWRPHKVALSGARA